MSIETNTVVKLAKLARIKIADADIAPIEQSLQSILNLVDQMSTFTSDTLTTQPYMAGDDKQFLRDDLVTSVDQRESFQELTASKRDGLYIVPLVVNAR